jgi:hypothetical protein
MYGLVPQNHRHRNHETNSYDYINQNDHKRDKLHQPLQSVATPQGSVRTKFACASSLRLRPGVPAKHFPTEHPDM